MASVNVTDLRQNLPAYLEKVRKGQRIHVTVRGKVVAELSPARPSGDKVKAARALLKGSVVRFDHPLEPAIEPHEWDVNR